MRVLSVSDLGFTHRGGSLYMRYQMSKESLGAQMSSAAPAVLGLKEIPT
jgi:hypothetical protein